MEESPGNIGHLASEREDIREGIVRQKKITVPIPSTRDGIRVRRWSKSPPVSWAISLAVSLKG